MMDRNRYANDDIVKVGALRIQRVIDASRLPRVAFLESDGFRSFKIVTRERDGIREVRARSITFSTVVACRERVPRSWIETSGLRDKFSLSSPSIRRESGLCLFYEANFSAGRNFRRGKRRK